MNRRLLVVTPSLGRSNVLEDTVSSIRSQASNSYRILVCPFSVVSIFSSQNSDFRGQYCDVIAEPASCKSLYSAINYAVEHCKRTDWTHLTYINDDDLLGSSFSKVLASHLESNANFFGYGRVVLIDATGRVSSQIPTESNPRWFEALLAQGISPLNQQGMIIPRLLWEKLGGFRTEYKLCADLDFWLRAHRLDWPFKYYSEEVGQFRIREGQLSGDTKKLEAEIAAVVARDAPRQVSRLEKFYARWQFRIKNLPIYVSRFIRGRQVRGIKMLAGK